MGKARRLKKSKMKMYEKESSSIFKDEKELSSKEKFEKKAMDKITKELKDYGLPTEFASTKGQHIEGQVNVEAKRLGMIRRYQSFQRRKLKQWQMTKIRGSRVKQRKNAAQVVQ